MTPAYGTGLSATRSPRRTSSVKRRRPIRGKKPELSRSSFLTRVTSRWGSIDADAVRTRLVDVNDGVIAVAGMGLGLAGADVASHTTYAITILNTVVGALAVFGVRLGEEFAGLEAEQATIAHEQRLLELSPDEELAEMIEWFEHKGVSPETSRTVAEELSAADSLSTQLEIEYGIRERTTPRQAWQESVMAGVGFALGALIPAFFAIVTPWRWHVGSVILAMMASLVVTSVLLARLGHSAIWPTILRSVIVGVSALGISYLLGDLLL